MHADGNKVVGADILVDGTGNTGQMRGTHTLLTEGLVREIVRRHLSLVLVALVQVIVFCALSNLCTN